MVNLRPRHKLFPKTHLNAWAFGAWTPLPSKHSDHVLNLYESRLQRLDKYYSRRRWTLKKNKLSMVPTIIDAKYESATIHGEEDADWIDLIPEFQI